MSKQINTKGFRDGINVNLFKLENLDDKIKLLETYQSIIQSDLWYYRSLKPKPKLPEIPASLKNKQKYLDRINKLKLGETVKNKFVELLKKTQITRDNESVLTFNGSFESYVDLIIDKHEYELVYINGTNQDDLTLRLLNPKDNS